MEGNGNSEGVGMAYNGNPRGGWGLKEKCAPWEESYGYFLELHNCFWNH